MKELKIGDLTAKVPIIQGGMGVGISLSGLAASVANEGGIGVIATAGIGWREPGFDENYREANKSALRKEIRKARSKTTGIIGVNIMVALSDFEDLVLIAVEEEVDVVFLSAGLPLRHPRLLELSKKQKIKTKFVPKVSSGRSAGLIFKYWAKNYGQVPEGVVVEGPMAGGHLGFKKSELEDPKNSLEKIMNDVMENIRPFEEQFKVSIPVIAAGGIYSGADVYKFLELGAAGVMMATRFVGTFECDVDERFKEAYLGCRKDSLTIIDSPVGLPGRAINNTFLDDVTNGIKKPFKCLWKCLKTCELTNAPYCIALALTSAKDGLLENGFAFAGTNAYLVDKIVSVKTLINTIIEEYERASGNFKKRFTLKIAY
jgi:nitronate monooxygenase